MYKFEDTFIDWIKLIKPILFKDKRGFFMESYSKKEFKENWISWDFVQDNYSKSKKWVLRWLHFQTKNSQWKLVKVISWEIYDICVDLRKNSKTYWKYFWIILDDSEKNILYIPPWIAHWFLVLKNNTIVSYNCDKYYDEKNNIGISYDDKFLNINWWDYFDMDKIILSKKDKNLISFKEYEKNNKF